MARVNYSRLAESDLYDIGVYTLQTWGAAQALAYLDELEASCHQLASNPDLGRSCSRIRSGLRRHEQGKHVIFFRRVNTGITVSRILHGRMLPEAHSFEEDET